MSPSTAASTTASSSTTSQSATTSETDFPPVDFDDISAPDGALIVIDPGHNGANAAHPEIIHKQVPAGFGQYKNCNTTGTSTNDGYTEHRFNWQVAQALKTLLQDKGISVVMTRDSDDGVGPCVNRRAAIGNDEYNGRHADAVVSIHGDGETESIHGFFVMTAAKPPAGAEIDGKTQDLAVDIRDGLKQSGFAISNAIGTNGLWGRKDLGGLNLSERPTVMLECGNMRNAAEAKMMSSAKGQQQYAQGIAVGVLAFLNR